MKRWLHTKVISVVLFALLMLPLVLMTVRTAYAVTYELDAPVITLCSKSTGVRIDWGEIPQAELYRIYRRISGSSWEILGYTKSTHYTDKTAQSGTRYSYAVRCVSADKEQLQSSYAAKSITYIAAPVFLSADGGQSGITLKWDAVEGAVAYRILYKTGSGSWKKLTDTAATGYTDTSVSFGQSRTYIIRCIDKIGGNSVSGYYAATTTKRLARPEVSLSSKSGKIVLKWSAIDGAEKYRVYRIEDGKRKSLGSTTGTSYSVAAENGQSICFAVRCVSEDGSHVHSSYRSVTGQYTAYNFRDADRTMAGYGYFSAAGGLDWAQQQGILRYMNSYYSATGSFSVYTGGVFASTALRQREETLWNSVIAIRQKALEDLSLKSYRFTLRTVSVEKVSDSKIRVKLLEDCRLQFRDISVPSYIYGSDHSFTLLLNSAGKWRISAHSSECSPFYNFQYDAATQTDKLLKTSLQNIDARQATWGAKTGVSHSCAHPYNRTAAKNYMLKWISTRNPKWAAYDENGGNCMNFASQVLYNGGIHKTAKWTWRSKWDCTSSWINVGGFTDYAAAATKKELHCTTTSNYYSGDVGDLVLIGSKDARSHATVISEVVRDAAGRTIDYLLCCNTTNLKNFPAAAYHYTNQHLIRIYGWHD